MTVKMSTEGDSSKNLSSESKEKSEAENTDSSQDVDAKPDTATENNIEKKDEESKPKDAAKEASDEADSKTDSAKVVSDKAENSKADAKASEKKEEKNDDKDDDDNSDEQDDEDSEKEGDDEKEVPLLDQPLEKSGKRERKNVQRFNEDFPTEPKDIEFPNGSGTTLGSIPRIDASISRFKNDDMKLFHKILFKVAGKSTMIKKNIKKFNGFDFKKDSDEYIKKVAFMHKCDVKQLKSICEMLDLLKSGNKDDIIERILDFLLDPKDSGKAVGGGRPKRTAAVRANNRGYSSHDNYSSDERHSGRSGRDKGRRSNLKDDSSSASDEDFEPSDEGSDEKPRVTKRKRGERRKIDESDDEEASELESASSDDSDFQEEPKNKRKRTVKPNNKTKGKTTGAKRGRKPGPAKKPVKGGRKKNRESSEEDEEEEESDHKEDASSSSEDEPLVKKTTKSAQPPTDDEIKSYVKEILEGANLEQITMKTVCQQVYEHYPDFDLAHKKDFIKATVKSLIST